jgi:hypothetical protein
METLVLPPVEEVIFSDSQSVPPELSRIAAITDGQENTYVQLVNVPYASDDSYRLDVSEIPDNAVISKITVKARVRNIIANRTTYIKPNVYANDGSYQMFYGLRKMVWKTTPIDYVWDWIEDPVEGVAWAKQKMAERCFGVSLEGHLNQTILYSALEIHVVFTVP